MGKIRKTAISAFLAFVLLLGMLPQVTFAVDTQAPAADSSGVYQIGNAEDLLWFQQQVSAGKTSINAALIADIDLSSVCNETVGSWVAIPAYAGTFDGQGHKISNLFVQNATTAKQGLFAELTAAGKVCNVGVVESSVSMTTAKVVNNSYAAILVGSNSGNIQNCYVANSTVLTNTVMAKAAALCGGSTGTILNCFAIGNTITEQKNGRSDGE